MDVLPATALADGRFRLTRVVGEGGMGVVYEAFDKDVRSPVALKMMRTSSGESVLRLKGEFRSLRDVRHPNLVRLGELFADASRCFFTMELVEGVDLLSHVINPEILRRRAAERPTHSGGIPSADDTLPGPERTVWDADTLRLEVPFDEDRLRAALRQTALALAALHQAGKIHRDVKPTNILITSDGRAVLLDLGLASERGTPAPEGHIEGTIEYMAPEQASGAAAEPAADLYALGAILYESLTGRPPFVGDVIDVITQKRTIDPVPPSLMYAGIPPDLDELCMSLLARDAARRPSALDVAQGMASGAWAPRPLTSPRVELPFIGRADELAALSRAFADSARKPIAVLVSGESGLGKSRVLHRFANDVRATGSLIFAGRCHAQETVSFRAFDGIADALSRYLLALPPDEREDLLPADVAGLARLFRVFERLAPAAPPSPTGLDVRARRRRAFAALHELLTNLSGRGPLTLIIDDLHWIDSDSLMLFEGIMANNPPPLLLVGMVRPVKRVKQLEDGLARLGLEVRRIDLPPLEHAQSVALARTLLPSADAATLERLALTAQGSPHFLEQIAAAVADGDPAAEDLEQLVGARIASLDDGPRLVLELICVAAAAFEQATIGRAAGLSRTELNAAISELEERRLVRLSGGRRQDFIEPYHDQIRQAATRRLSPEDQQQRHRALAEALERRSASPWLVVHHWLGAAEPARAAPFALAAAVASQHELAARHVARLCAAAIELLPESDAAYRHLCRALATALANAGQGGDAAEWYLRAAAAAPEGEPVEALELRRLAGDHLLRCGRIDEGMAVMHDVLAAVGVTLPRGGRRALLSFVWRRARLEVRRWRGAAAPKRIDAAARLRADVCLSCGTSLAVVDSLAGASLHARGLDEALRIGDRDRIALGLALDAGFSALPGTRGAARTAEVLAEAERAVAEIGSPLPAATLAWVRGMVAYLQGRYRDAARLNDAAARQFAETCPGRIWEQSQAELFAAWSVAHLGDLTELSARIGDLERVARWSDDRYIAAQVRAGQGVLPWLAADRADEAETRVTEAATTWSQSGFHVQHVLELWGRCEIDLYRGDGMRAWQRLRDQWPALEQSLLLRLQHTAITAHDLRARAAIAAGDHALLADAERSARRMIDEGAPWGIAFATTRLAAIAAARGDHAGAVRRLAEAADLLEAADLGLHCAAARLRLASLEAGPLERSPAYLVLTSRGIKRPERFMALYAPWRTLAR